MYVHMFKKLNGSDGLFFYFVYFLCMYGYIRSTYSKWVINLFQKSQALLHWPCCVGLGGGRGADQKEEEKKKNPWDDGMPRVTVGKMHATQIPAGARCSNMYISDLPPPVTPVEQITLLAHPRSPCRFPYFPNSRPFC